MKNLSTFLVVLSVVASCSTPTAQMQEQETAIYSPFIVQEPEGELFNITFEDGNLNEFDSTPGTGLSAVAPGLVATVYCQAVNIADTQARYGQISAGFGKSRIRLFFVLDTNGVTIGSGDEFTVALVQDGSGNDVFRVELGYDSVGGYRVRPGIMSDGGVWSNGRWYDSDDGYRVRPGIMSDGGVWSNGSWVDLSDNEHTIEVEWNRSSSSRDGSIEMWVDAYDVDDFGTADSSVSGVDNDAKTARVFRFGAPAGLDSGTSGTIWLDQMVANDDTSAIGHPGVLAFPGAEGAGRYTVGGRGGMVYQVTNLNDSGAGSLRAALEASGPRVVVFGVAGTIGLKRDIKVRHPYVSILGQTAPGDGIAVRGATIRVRTHDVIMRHIRIRPGDGGLTDPEDLDCLSVRNNPSGPTDVDGMGFNVIIDHCSFSWATDENVGLWNVRPDVNFMKNITIQWSIISEGLKVDNRSLGLLVGATEHVYSLKNVSIHHNLFVHNRVRNPVLAAVSPAEVVNNVMHDCPGYTAAVRKVPTHVNFIGNTAKGQTDVHTLLVEPELGPDSPVEDYLAHRIYVDDNRGNFYDSDNWEIVGKGWGAKQKAGGAYRAAWELDTPVHIANSKLQAAERSAAYDAVLGRAGCFPRDKVDERVVQDIIDDNTGLIGSQDEIGGWPTLSSGPAPTDSDNDGMPDDWEDEHGLDRNVADDAEYDPSPIYTNLEVYSHDLVVPVIATTTTGALSSISIGPLRR